jgi:hypothetical protein
MFHFPHGVEKGTRLVAPLQVTGGMSLKKGNGRLNFEMAC